MAKLYWRVKQNGKWKYVAAEWAEYLTAFGPEIVVVPYQKEEELPP